MIYASDFKKGITFEINGEPHIVLDFQHVKPERALLSSGRNTRTYSREPRKKKPLTPMTSSRRPI